MEAALTAPANKTTLGIDRLTLLFNMLNNKSGPGRPVPYSDARECIAMWSYKMSEHGVGRDAPFNINITRRMDITNYVIFGGPALLEWLDGVITRNEDAALNDEIEIHVAYGIYTLPYVNTHVEAEERHRHWNRMTVFLVPVHKTERKILVNDDDEVFNLGGLQP